MGLTGWFVTEHAARPEGIYVVSFVLDVGGKLQSAFLPFVHQLPIPGRWQPCRTVGRNPVVALVAQWIERLTTDRRLQVRILSGALGAGSHSDTYIRLPAPHASVA